MSKTTDPTLVCQRRDCLVGATPTALVQEDDNLYRCPICKAQYKVMDTLTGRYYIEVKEDR